MHELLECRMAGIDVVELPTFLERETGKVRLDVTSPSWFIFGEGFRFSPLQLALGSFSPSCLPCPMKPRPRRPKPQPRQRMAARWKAFNCASR